VRQIQLLLARIPGRLPFTHQGRQRTLCSRSYARHDLRKLRSCSWGYHCTSSYSARTGRKLERNEKRKKEKMNRTDQVVCSPLRPVLSRNISVVDSPSSSAASGPSLSSHCGTFQIRSVLSQLELSVCKWACKERGISRFSSSSVSDTSRRAFR
jgi:hypothetical protein